MRKLPINIGTSEHRLWAQEMKSVLATSQGPAYDIYDDHHHNHEERRQGKTSDKEQGLTSTCIPLAYLCGDLWLHLFSHGSRARAAATSLRSPQEDIREVKKRKERHQERRQRHPHHI